MIESYDLLNSSGLFKIEENEFRTFAARSYKLNSKGEKIYSSYSAEKEKLNREYNLKEQECDSLKMSDKDWFSKVNQCNREASSIKSEIMALETEEFKLDNTNYTVYYDKVYSKNYIFISILGGVVILVGGTISLSIYLIAKRRDIAAFTIQQTMPLAQETIEKMAPTVGDAAGMIGKGIAKGISSGIKEGLKDKDDE